MEDIDSTVALKEKLLTAGIDEIMTNGLAGLSLRKVAASCGASCAAPYKHFKNKDDFVAQIVEYIDDKWTLLAEQIIASIEDSSERIASLCTANVRFYIANPLYNMAVPKNRLIAAEVERHCAELGIDEAETQMRIFSVRIMTGGTAALIEKGSLTNCPETLAMLHKKILSELK